MNVWIATDWHLWMPADGNHNATSQITVNKIIQNCKENISENDVLIHLGDLTYHEFNDCAKLASVIQEIPGYKILCRGDHDRGFTNDELHDIGFDIVCDIAYAWNMVFSHKPVKVSDDYINIHGHLHNIKLSTLSTNHINAYHADNKLLLVELSKLLADATTTTKDASPYDDQKFNKALQFVPWSDGGAVINIEDFITDHSDDHPVDEASLNEILFDEPEDSKYWLTDDYKYEDDLVCESSLSISEKRELAKKRNVPIFICLFHFSSVMSTVIAAVTGDKYSHSAISFDTSLTDMYSFGKFYPNNPVIGKFVHESLFGPTYNQVTRHSVYAVFVTPEEKQMIKDKLEWFIANKQSMRYNYEGLIKSLINMADDDVDFKYAYLCSEFVASLLKETGRDLIQTSSNLVKPMDFTRYSWAYELGAGEGRAYDRKAVDRKLVEIQKQRDRGNELYLESAVKSNMPKKNMVNDKGPDVPKVCPKCGSKVGIFIHGEPVFLCTNKKCKTYFGTVPFNESATNSYVFELANKNEHLRFVDAITESTTTEKLYPVYIMLMHTGTTLATAIKAVTNSHFSHSSISFDSSMKNMYSFGRKMGVNPLVGSFKSENIYDNFYKGKQIPFALYVVPATSSEIANMKKRLDFFIKNSTKFKYDFTGLFKNYFGIADNPEYKWFCSRFVADIINAGKPSEHPYVVEPSLMRPEDFTNTNFAQYVTGGYLHNYDPKFVDRVTDKLLRAEYLKRKTSNVNESAVINLDDSNPYGDLIIGYKLSNMDESAFNNFVDFLGSFKIRFDKSGGLIISRREYNNLESHFKNCQRAIKAYEKADNIAGVKEELAKLYYMVQIINKYYVTPKPETTVDPTIKKKMVDLRSVMLNMFQQHLKYVTAKEPSFNFQKYYDGSKYGNNLEIPKATLDAIGKTIVTALK